MKNDEIQKEIDNFFKEHGKNKYKEINGNCFKNKKKCPYTKSGSCRGWCMGQGMINERKANGNSL